jgi:hypothetical protein
LVYDLVMEAAYQTAIGLAVWLQWRVHRPRNRPGGLRCDRRARNGSSEDGGT